MNLHLFGIRHHGPGCARSLRAALEELQPDVVVMEGPADAVDALELAAHPEIKPPVAMLIYPPDEPARAVYFPLTVFSPEWQTLRWASENKVPVRLMDLPQSHHFALAKTAEEELAKRIAEETPSEGTDETSETQTEPTERTWRADPLALLAEAAGYQDHEMWWEEQIERRSDATGLFAAILEAMRTVREEFDETRERDLLREAYMRKTLREVLKEKPERIAVVCGAWHTPVLDEDALNGKRTGLKKSDDAKLLKGLPKLKTKATWIPWTHSRLSYQSGYGAGVRSPGWYAHLWNSQETAGTRWIATTARLLRDRDLDASSASVIEAVRLADALAAMRELRSPGLAELNDAVQTVLCHGDATPMRLIRRKLEIGDMLGEVPEDTPAVPLAQDLARLQKSLRLKPTSENRVLDLDLRKENHLARSHLLHRLHSIGIPWGHIEQTGGRVSTFHEVWRIEWQPEFAVAIIEANVWGNTVEAAATAKMVQTSTDANDLSVVTNLLDQAILAGLDAATEPLLDRIQTMAAVGADVRHLMHAMPPLARVARYSDVRGTRAEQIEPILVGIFERITVGLAPACASLDDDAAERMLTGIGHVNESLDTIAKTDQTDEWQQCLRRLMTRNIHPLLRGWCVRVLLEKAAITDDELDTLARRALSSANPPDACAHWVTGLLRGSGLLLLHQDSVWRVFDRWLSGLDAETFIEMLPMIRRAFADFSSPERRQMGEKVKHLATDSASEKPATTATESATLNTERARKVLPVLAHILGVKYDATDQ
ncbi:DUF5682 family protein [Thalassoroseus pseudoceratinae]|uniref:DUF5682 family protein n=1 Tax=Thalassoroseus pseudoceratinae TaxID=2713176 RepID=UPI001421C7AA|nr:DUF5682 family protein [Thalassoroseus pseudoceratinae]